MEGAGGGKGGVAELVGARKGEDEIVRCESLGDGYEVDSNAGCVLLA